jgi:hypothetical protein
VAPKDAPYSGLIECPCTDRRDINVENNTIDGVPQTWKCAGEIEKQNNTACSIATYTGGLRCCEHGVVLLDKDQEQPDGVDQFNLKVRIWFEKYTEDPQPSHKYVAVAVGWCGCLSA